MSEQHVTETLATQAFTWYPYPQYTPPAPGTYMVVVECGGGEMIADFDEFDIVPDDGFRDATVTHWSFIPDIPKKLMP